MKLLVKEIHSCSDMVSDDPADTIVNETRTYCCRRFPQYVGRLLTDWCGEFDPIDTVVDNQDGEEREIRTDIPSTQVDSSGKYTLFHVCHSISDKTLLVIAKSVYDASSSAAHALAYTMPDEWTANVVPMNRERVYKVLRL